MAMMDMDLEANPKALALLYAFLDYVWILDVNTSLCHDDKTRSQNYEAYPTFFWQIQKPLCPQGEELMW